MLVTKNKQMQLTVVTYKIFVFKVQYSYLRPLLGVEFSKSSMPETIRGSVLNNFSKFY